MSQLTPCHNLFRITTYPMLQLTLCHNLPHVKLPHVTLPYATTYLMSQLTTCHNLPRSPLHVLYVSTRSYTAGC